MKLNHANSGESQMGNGRRVMLARAIAPVLRMTGFRFSKAYRHGETRWHRLVYAAVSTPTANLLAEGFSLER